MVFRNRDHMDGLGSDDHDGIRWLAAHCYHLLCISATQIHTIEPGQAPRVKPRSLRAKWLPSWLTALQLSMKTFDLKCSIYVVIIYSHHMSLYVILCHYMSLCHYVSLYVIMCH